jgi:hypothetical protein
VKAYGIRFIIMVKGTAGRFNFVPLALNIGSGLGLLAVVSFIIHTTMESLLMATNMTPNLSPNLTISFQSDLHVWTSYQYDYHSHSMGSCFPG